MTVRLGFFPLNLLFTVLVSELVPGWDALPVALRVLLTTLCLTPLMLDLLLPGVTRMLRRWLSTSR